MGVDIQTFKSIVQSYCQHFTYNEKVESQQGLSDTKPTKLVGHCYPGIPAELVGDGRTNDFVFENTDGRWPKRRKS